ncbi:acid phosphatase AphA [Leminorella grimontii]|uniref:acid phosphatase AphA n=1 Tax=Leminorella grimontii TaxID=82981 RepID=UPI00321F8A86
MRKLTLVVGAISLACSLNVFALSQPDTALYPGVDIAQISYQAPVHWVSVEQIKMSLEGKPAMAVGFDIDDTVLFSSPGFFRGQQQFSPHSSEFLNNMEFWEKMNGEWDKFSIPKESGRALISMHLERGDAIYFITARPQTKNEIVTQVLQEDFNIPADKMNKVIFVGEKEGVNLKVPAMKEKKIKVYYGDSNGDITGAREAGARGIRVLRPDNGTNSPLPKAGIFGEEVLVNSNR